MRVLVLGGDGFCGWPTSLYLSERGYDVTILDNLSRRKIDIDLEVGSLTPITAIGDRLRAWREVSGCEISFIDLDLATEYDRLTSVLRELRPEAIVHFAEQRAAPYSMRSQVTKRYTVDNNVRATHNLLAALVQTRVDAAIAHLGTMGVYGYGWSGTDPRPADVRVLRQERRAARHRPAPGHRLRDHGTGRGTAGINRANRVRAGAARGRGAASDRAAVTLGAVR